MIWPTLDTDVRALGFLKRQPFAHRGLHNAALGVPENSLAAFDRAIQAGWGIELDVRLTVDGDTVVFHDQTLDRLTEAHGAVDRYTRVQLERIKLKNGETIATLANVLLHIRGRVPVLIEAKVDKNNYPPLCFSIRRAVEGYRGPLAVMSFNPSLPGWFARHHAKIVRGLVMTEEERRPISKWDIRRRLKRQASVWRARPHFIAYDVDKLPSRFIEEAREQQLPVLTWTVRDEIQRAAAAKYADQIIFETSMAGA